MTDETPDIKPVEPAMNGVIPHVGYRDTREAISFYVRAFDAQEMMRLPGKNGGILYACIRLNGGYFYLGDKCQTSSNGPKAEGVVFHLEVPDVDTAFQKAIDAGATIQMPLEDTFWGARYGQLRDPFDITWSMATQMKDVSPQEMIEGANACSEEDSNKESAQR